MSQISQRLSHLSGRLRQITAFSLGARGVSDMWGLLVLGLARGHPLCADDGVSRYLHRRYPTITVRPRILRGHTVELDAADVSHVQIYEELVMEGIYDLSLVPFTPDVVIDCGAHIGLFTVLAASAYPDARMIAFEPDPANATFVRRQIARNHLPAEFIEAAVSTVDGQARFHRSEASFAGSLEASHENDDRSCVVKTVDLPGLIRDCSPQRLLLKIDIEGEEVRLMPRLLEALPRSCAVFIETHHGAEGWEAMSALFTGAGFTPAVTRRRDVYVDGRAVRA